MTSRIIVGDALDGLAQIESESVQCCVTSPPYWGLRDYGVAGQIGLEPTPEAYVAKLVAVFDEVRRVLRDDGVLWLNLGDSYAANRGSGASGIGAKQATNVGANLGKLTVPVGLKEKDLVGIPWRVAFALQSAGWYLRSDIIWAKPNPMPESVTDRPTKAHEYVFLLSKSARYFYDAAAIAEDGVCVSNRGGNAKMRREGEGTVLGRVTEPNGGLGPKWEPADTRNARTVWTISTQPYAEAHFATFPEELPERCIKAGSSRGDLILDPFSGSGTVGAVAERLGRDFIGCELNPKYAEMARKRIAASQSPMFDTPPVVAPVDDEQREIFA